MFPAFQFNEAEILAFALMLLRNSAFVVAWPLFSVYSVPNSAKVLFALILTMLLFPTVDRVQVSASILTNDLAGLALREVFVGLSLGFLTRLFFFAISVGGNLIATSMGLANAQVFNPALSMQVTPVEQFYAVIATLFFLTINGHHVFLTGLAESFNLLPLAAPGTKLASLNFDVFGEGGHFVQQTVLAGLKISAPVMTSIFFMNVMMGIVGRAVPQINVLITSLPVNIGVGLGVMIVMMPLFVIEMEDLANLMAEELFKFMKAL